MRMIRVFTILTWLVAAGPLSSQTNPSVRPNVLMIAVDDLNDWVGFLKGHPQASTPHIDGLASGGVAFVNAHCQAPLCNPSRSSLLTGLRPSTTGIHGLVPGIREVAATRERQTLPQAFLKAGYFSYTCGKVFHDGSVPRTQAEFGTWGPAPATAGPPRPFAQLPVPRHPAMDWGPWPQSASDHGDYKIASAAIEALGMCPKEKPFFIACGFRQPHVPCFAPREWFDRFPLDSLSMPELKDHERALLPTFSWRLHWRLPEPRLATLKDKGEWKPLVRAYLASTAFMDAQVGRVLDALKASGREDNTVIVLWSDHGYHLGEKEITGKNSLWERSTRVPLVFAGKGIRAQKPCEEPVELLDLYPTLLEWCALDRVAGLEGHSLAAQLHDSQSGRVWPAITTHNQGNHAVRSKRHRYIRYADGSEELYDLIADRREWNNLIGRKATDSIKNDLAGWLPKVDVPAAPASKHRVLLYDKGTGIATWEGESVKPTDSPPGP